MGAISRTSGSAHRWPVNEVVAHGNSVRAATVSASGGAPASPSTAPTMICPEGAAKPAMRTAGQATRRGRPVPRTPGTADGGYWAGDGGTGAAARGAHARAAGRGAAAGRRAALADGWRVDGPAAGSAAVAGRTGGHRRRAAGARGRPAGAVGSAGGAP